MTAQHQEANTQPTEAYKRRQRAQRILDAAAALILRWGYNKTTIDDIARQSGVAKGTIYLHWKTREDLFTALMKREKAELAADVQQRIAADPAGATLRGLLKHSALALMQRPLMKACARSSAYGSQLARAGVSLKRHFHGVFPGCPIGAG